MNHNEEKYVMPQHFFFELTVCNLTNHIVCVFVVLLFLIFEISFRPGYFFKGTMGYFFQIEVFAPYTLRNKFGPYHFTLLLYLTSVFTNLYLISFLF